MNYLQLTNDAIRESGISLDSLTSSNFGSTTDPMQIKFKGWIEQAWREIQMERGEWNFSVQDAVITISPRIYVTNGNRATAPAADYTYTTSETDVDLVVVGTTTLSGAWADGDATAFIDVETLEDALKLSETVDETDPDTGNTDTWSIAGRGRYDLSTLVSGFDTPLLEEFYIQSTGNSSIQDNTAGYDLTNLKYMEWSEWNNWYETDPSKGCPRIFTRTNQNTYDFWPAPDKQYVLKLSYNAAPTSLSAYTDTPSVDSKYHPAIVWKAVMFWAQYDHNQQAEIRAYKNYRFYKREMDRYLKPGYTWGTSLYG